MNLYTDTTIKDISRFMLFLLVVIILTTLQDKMELTNQEIIWYHSQEYNADISIKEEDKKKVLGVTFLTIIDNKTGQESSITTKRELGLFEVVHYTPYETTKIEQEEALRYNGLKNKISELGFKPAFEQDSPLSVGDNMFTNEYKIVYTFEYKGYLDALRGTETDYQQLYELVNLLKTNNRQISVSVYSQTDIPEEFFSDLSEEELQELEENEFKNYNTNINIENVNSIDSYDVLVSSIKESEGVTTP